MIVISYSLKVEFEYTFVDLRRSVHLYPNVIYRDRTSSTVPERKEFAVW